MATPSSTRKRADARRNEQALLDAAAAVFVTRGVDAPVRDIAAKAGVGMGTIYRHFPTRADLVVAVYRHQVEALAGVAPVLLASGETRTPRWRSGWTASWTSSSPNTGWPARCGPTNPGSLPCTPTSSTGSFLRAPRCSTPRSRRGEIRRDVDALTLMRGAGNLCIGVEAGGDTSYDAHRMVGLLIAGLRQAPPA